MKDFIKYRYAGYGVYLLIISSQPPNLAELTFDNEIDALVTKKLWEDFLNE